MTRENPKPGAARKYHLGDSKTNQSERLSERISPTNLTIQEFTTGLVFGFDFGTASLGYSVRHGSEFLDVGAIICDEEIGHLKDKRGHRQGRRTLRNKQWIREWLRGQLLGRVGLPLPSHIEQRDALALRVRALGGEKLSRTELHAAIAHLWRQRGYHPVPWKNQERNDAPDDNTEEGEVLAGITALAAEMKATGCKHPCEFLHLLERQQAAWRTANRENRPVVETWRAAGLPGSPGTAAPKLRKRVWPRKLLVEEFKAIVGAQSAFYPELREHAHWILFGDTRRHETPEGLYEEDGKSYVHIFFKRVATPNPGVASMKWPRFDNRNPGLDQRTPEDADGRKIHVVKKSCEAFKAAQWEIAIENFRVRKMNGQHAKPDAASLARLREIWLAGKRVKDREAIESGALPDELKVSTKVLERWAEEMRGKYELIEGQTDLVSKTSAGRARYSTPTLRSMVQGEVRGCEQTLLRRASETRVRACDRFLGEIRNRVVGHRLRLFRDLLRELSRKFGQPSHVVIESARSFGMGRKRKKEHIEDVRRISSERDAVRQDLKKENQSASRDSVLRFQLWKETGSRCPFCGDTIHQADLFNGNADIAHIYPRALAECNERYNLTIAHAKCNRVDMLNRIPLLAFPERAEAIRDFARKTFRFPFQQQKLKLFLCESNEEAAELIDAKNRISQTAYISRLVRAVCLLEVDGWLPDDGRDPSDREGNLPSKRFHVSNGGITHRLRTAWGLDSLLYPPVRRYSDEEWEQLSDAEKTRHKVALWERRAKNRSDHRHHALDAMVLACTLPWLAHRVVNPGDNAAGDPIWWELPEGERRTRAVNPVFPSIAVFRQIAQDKLKIEIVRHHVSRSRHRSGYKTTFYSRRKENVFIGREELHTLSRKNLKDVHPEEFGLYLQHAWPRYLEQIEGYVGAAAAEFWKLHPLDSKPGKKELAKLNRDFCSRVCLIRARTFTASEDTGPLKVAALLKEGEARSPLLGVTPLDVEAGADGKPAWVLIPAENWFTNLPPDFGQRLCFSAFQRWRAELIETKQEPAFAWPARVVIPIRSVRLIQPVNDKNVYPPPELQPSGFGGLNAFIKRTEFAEVRVHLSEDEKELIAVFVPMWRKQPLFAEKPWKRGKPIAILRKDQIIELKTAYSEKYGAGRYRIEKFGEQVTLMPPHLAVDKDALQAAGFAAKGLQAYWHILLPCLGYELPHSASAQPESPGAAEA